ncbi:MAG: aspartate carbamoyltransferase, partial [Acidilobaceae archaeon]
MISILDFNKEELESIFEIADDIVSRGVKGRPLEGKIVSLAFFEPSTR